MSEACDCYDEVARLHRFFQDWFQGVLPDQDFALCENALAAGFTIVTPGGALVTREEILEAIRTHRGEEPDDFTIETVGRHCQQVRGLHLTTYEERQMGPRPTVRLSTATISRSDVEFRWHAVHETWITV